LDGVTAHSLTQLFRGYASLRTLDFRTARLTFEAQNGSTVTVHPRSPSDAADYLVFLRAQMQSRGLFSPAYITETLQEPIVFTVEGNLTRVIAGHIRKEYRMLHAMNLRFFTAENGGERGAQLLFQEEFGAFGAAEHAPHSAGPTMPEFIDVLRPAGEDWRKVNFIAHNPRRHMRLVKR